MEVCVLSSSSCDGDRSWVLPGGFGFRASDFITGGGLAAGLLLRRRGVGASFVSGEPAVVRLQFAPLLPLLARLLISVQRFTSILVGPRWWLLQLNQGLESAIGGSGGADVGGGDRPGDERKKMNRSPRDFLEIFFFFLYLVEKGGCIVLHINISSLIESSERAGCAGTGVGVKQLSIEC